MSFVQNLFSERIGGSNFGKDTKIYKFQKIKNAKQEALKNNHGIEILDFGIGEPDDMAPVEIRERLKIEVDKLENRFYADNGIEEFKEAASRYMKSLYGVDIDSKTEVIHGIGSKPVLALIPLAFINPGDYTLMTVPGYPVMGTYTQYLGGNVYNMPLVKENNFLPDLDRVPADIRKKAKLLYLNYPNNPTGAGATVEFFKKAIKFAKENDIIVVHDAAYAALFFKSEKPLSFLSVKGAKEVGVEIHSMSKAFNMTGWRLSFICGNELVVKGYANVKDNTDSGQFRAIQKAAVEGLDNYSLTDPIKAKYKRRIAKLVDVLKKKGFDADMPFGTFYLYVQIPKGVKGGRKFKNAEDFTQFLIKEKLISTVPWDDAGNFFRMSVTFEAKDEKDEERVLAEFEKRLSDMEFDF
jgi:LL-diaminopimelate aminotransferase